MHLHDFLARVHQDFEPRTYLEVGVRLGKSLTLSRVPSIGIDPAFEVRCPLHCDLHLVKATSDDHFARANPIEHFDGLPIDLAFIDGMHLFEYALRDFMNVERHSHAGTVVVFDDMLPSADRDADRARHRGFWAGDVFKIIPVLHRYRPDLRLIPVSTSPTGVLMVIGLDPQNTVLNENYDQIVSEFVVDDPQQVPPLIKDRSCALEPDQVLNAPLAKRLHAARDGDGDGAKVAADVDAMLGLTRLPKLGDWTPEPAGVRADNASESRGTGKSVTGAGGKSADGKAGGESGGGSASKQAGAASGRGRHPLIRAVGRALPSPVRRRLRRYAVGRRS